MDKQVFKTGVTHYFSIAAAKRDLGYEPDPRDLSGVVRWFRERGHGKRKQEGWSGWLLKTLLATIVLTVLWTLLMSLLPTVH